MPNQERSSQTEQFENREQLKVAARNIIDCFGFQPGKESLLVITDSKVMEVNPTFIEAIRDELDGRTESDPHTKGNWEMFVVPASPKSATPLGEQIGRKMMDRPVLIVTSMSRSHSQETGAAIRGNLPEQSAIEEILNSPVFIQAVEQGDSGFSSERLSNMGGKLPDSMYEKMRLMAKVTRSRLISITKGHNPYEILTSGAVLESVEALRGRSEKIVQLMSEVKRVHITTPFGTDLWLTNRPDLTEVEDGAVNKPGQLSNYPIGEWSCSPDWVDSSGVLVVDGPCGGNINQDVLDQGEPLRLVFKDGEVVEATGGVAALNMWKEYLNSGNNDHNDAYRLAELGIGINTKALEGKPREWWGSSEGEKKYGTVHIAVGSNGSFGRQPGSPNFNAAKVHCDMVIGLNPGGEVTVDCENNDGSTFRLIENSAPQEY